MNALQAIFDRPKRDSYKTRKPSKRQRTALDDVFDQSQNELYNAGAPGNLGRSALQKPSTSVRSKTKRANQALGRTSSGTNFADDYGIVQNPRRGIRGTMPGGMVDAGGGIPPRQRMPDPTPAAVGDTVLMGSGFASELLDAADRQKSFGDSVDAGKTLTSAPSRQGLQQSTSRPARTISGHNPEKFAAAVERRKNEKALARQRQFARAQMKSGFLFNEDGSADLMGSMASQSFEQNPGLAGILAMARQQGELGAEENAISRMLAQEQVNQGEFGRSDTAHDRQMGLLDMQTAADRMRARNEGRLTDYQTDHDAQMDLLFGQNLPAWQQAQTAQEALDWQRDPEYLEHQERLAGINDLSPLEETMQRSFDFQQKFGGDPESLANAVLRIGDATRGMNDEEKMQAIRQGPGLQGLLNAKDYWETWNPNTLSSLDKRQQRIQDRAINTIEDLLDVADPAGNYSSPSPQPAPPKRANFAPQDQRRYFGAY